MIHSKLKKGKTSELLVQFSRDQQNWPNVIQKFYDQCKDENVKINKSFGLKPEMIRFYTVIEEAVSKGSSKSVSYEQKSQFNNRSQYPSDLQSLLKSSISSIQLKFTVIYINQQTYPLPQFQQFTKQIPNQRVLLLRQTLQNFYHIDYEIQNTLSEPQSVIYLCDLAAMIVNCIHENQIEVYDQKKEKMIRKGNQGQMTEMEVIWRNILYQTPGLGKDKCKIIANQFPTYRHILDDCDKGKKLKNLMVGKGAKSMKIGSAIAQRIYKVFGSLNGKQALY